MSTLTATSSKGTKNQGLVTYLLYASLREKVAKLNTITEYRYLLALSYSTMLENRYSNAAHMWLLNALKNREERLLKDSNEWPTHQSEAKKLYKQAEEYDWKRQHDYADELRRRADKLMQNPEQVIPPF